MSKKVQLSEKKVDEKKEIKIPQQMAYELKLHEYDKKIAEAESELLGLRKDKATFIFDASVHKKMSMASAYERLIQQVIETHKESGKEA